MPLLLRWRAVTRYNVNMKRQSALLVIGAAALLPTVRLERLQAAVRRNNPQEWGRWWISQEICCVNPFYPRDGRETIYRPYERFARTDTVGAYLDVRPYLWGAPQGRTLRGLPADFDVYLMQRIPEHRYLEFENPSDKIDAFGKLVRVS